MSIPNTTWNSATDDGLEHFQASIEATCLAFIESQDIHAVGLGEDAMSLFAHARHSVSGGKRLRAAFAWWGFQSVTPITDAPALLRACSSLEFLHASALVHDDYMDASDLRRGQPATHRAYAARHRSSNWSGDPDRYGAAGAILLGDLLLSWADQVLRTAGLPAEQTQAGLTIFDITRTEVVLGQFLDVSAQARSSRNVDHAMTVLRYKSAKYSIERPLHLGAALANGTSDQLTAMTAFGIPLGEAFQLRDDVLGIFGDPSTTGKPSGDDLREGKRTVLTAMALQSLSPVDAQRLDEGLGADLNAADITELCDLIEASGARDRVERLIADLTAHSLKALVVAPIREPARAVLIELAHAATQRNL